MNEAKRKIIIYALLVAAIIYGLANFPGGTDKNHTDTSIDNPAPAAQKIPASAKQSIDIKYYSSLPWGSDPFCRYYARADNGNGSTDAPAPQWTLNGVVINAKTTVAVINKNIVHVGDKIAGARVVDIQKDKVVMEQDGSQFSIQITRGET